MTDTIAVILAGGKGTRSADPSIPKLSQLIGGESQLDYHINLLTHSSVKAAVVVAGYLGEQVKSLVNKSNSKIPISLLQETESSGTVPALQFANSEINADRYLVLLGDILCSFNVDLFLNEWQASGKSVAVVTHPSTHPNDSDVIFSMNRETSYFRSKQEDKTGIPNMSSTGIFAMTSEAISKYSKYKDIGSEVLRSAALENDLFCWIDSHYFKDTGTPSRLENANDDLADGTFRRRGKISLRPAIFLDRDGVINPAVPEVYKAFDYRLFKDVAHEISQVNELGIPIFLVTNQPGIAKGFMTEEDHVEIRAELDRQLSEHSAFIDEYAYCPHHPDKGFKGEVPSMKVQCLCRKPGTLLVEDLSRRHGIDLSNSIMIGDTWRDQQLAANSGMIFYHVRDKECDLSASHACFATSAKAIEIARNELLR